MKKIIVRILYLSNIKFLFHKLFLLLEQPISFFLFTIHPTLFSRSVENIFHVSFLIKVSEIEKQFHQWILFSFKEGKAELLLDKNQLPVLRKSLH